MADPADAKPLNELYHCKSGVDSRPASRSEAELLRDLSRQKLSMTMWLFIGIAVLCASLTVAQGVRAEGLSELLALRKAHNAENLSAQHRVEALSDEIDQFTLQRRGVAKQISGLEIYNRQMVEVTGDQSAQIADVSAELLELNLVSRDITPLMLRMIDALEEFVALDVPFLREERADRIERLRRTMIRSDVTEAEKYRLIMEAYQVENDYGRTIEAYRASFTRDGQEVTVDFLRIGRIALVYQTLDEREAGVWSQNERAWFPLDGQHLPAIRQGLRVARKLEAPDMLRMPLPMMEQLKVTGGQSESNS